ncbi:UMF1 family MFS transporter [Herbihabitans rhizosphaerae]|uniref:UMF1 family MFS transporter n=1 Tax=Herbihabitans rhizosphaerae TaxID=1872711 RepID=A0A4Q7L2G5_9PSEU|nr:MFS transporter [Herbihabitans rhizosphaerae]RZS43739.1 UMF1 family MFS transporter [Herbihabitans rhizosphaerae]
MSVVDDSPGAAESATSRRREQRAWYWYDWANTTFYTSVTTVFGAIYFSSIAAEDAKTDIARNGPQPCMAVNADTGVFEKNTLVNCDVSLFGIEFPAGALWGYLLAAATLIQVLVLPITGAIADRSHAKKRMLATFAFIGAGSTCLLVTVVETTWQPALIFYTIGQVGYGASIVVYYSFLPQIAEADERDDVSARGWAFGFLGGGCALALQLVLVTLHETFGIAEGTAVRLCFVISGLWWAGFTLIPLRRLKQHQVPPHEAERGASVLTAGFRELRTTFKAARAFPLTLAFLGAYLVYTDGISTVVSVSAQYGTEELKFGEQTLIITILVIQFVAYLGGMLHGLVARRLGAKRTILGSLVVWIVVLVCAYFVKAGEELQFFALAAGIGLVLGGTVALSRSLFSQMIPRGKEAQYFSLYEICERGTAWMGPLLFASIGHATGTFRYAIIALGVFFVVGFVLLWLVPVRKAIRAAGNAEPERL